MIPIGCDAIIAFAFLDVVDRTTTRRTFLRPAPQKTYEEASFELAPGTPISIKECLDSMCKVQITKGYTTLENPYDTRDGRIETSGWIARADIGTIYRPNDFEPSKQDLCYRIPKGTKVYDGNNKTPIAYLTDGDLWKGESLETTFSFIQRRIKGKGRFLSQKIASTPCLNESGGGSCGWNTSHGIYRYLKRGEPVFDRPKGELVGVVVQDTKVLLLEERAGWYNISVPTHWKDISFWVPKKD